jgi:hypothetical protein
MRIANLNGRTVLLTAAGSAVDVELTSYVEGIGELHQTFYAG